ncbi:unnamed protein product [Leptosia nina]|uniref:Uncharacterized protein n=1 Tax=Leptosia nina TaxID=320188 RepID=A0AAV1ITP3_9NEOP
MEELLNKDIFHDAELIKHGPDYKSADIYLRLQLRRNMAKDTHKHTSTIANGPKTLLKRKVFNNAYTVNRELAKMHTIFRKKRAKNNLIIKKQKSLFKNISSTIPTEVYRSRDTADSQYKMLQQEMNTFLEKSQEMYDLKVENEVDFKLIPKLKQDKYEFKTSMKPKVADRQDSQKKELNRQDNDESQQNIISKIEHEFSCKSNDLQSLLIMMTINSSYDNEKEISEDDISCKELESYPNLRDESGKVTVTNIDKTEISDYINVSSIKNVKFELRARYIERKYVQKWRQYIIRKNEKNSKFDRKATVNKFIDRLAKAKDSVKSTAEPIQKAKMNVRDYNSYHHRYRVQKHIIALQKAKLEQQNKVIEELKYNKIIEASRHSVDCMKEEVRKSYYELDKHLKPKIKCLTNELNIKEIEEPALILQCLKVPQFLQRMEARAREREEKHAIIRERRKQIEEERLRIKQQVELQRAEMDKEEKTKRIKELKEKRKQEKIENIRKKQHAERMRALIVMADFHYEKTLITKYGIRPFQRLIRIKHESVEKAKAHYTFQVKKNIFLQWMFYTEDMWFERNYIAVEHYRKRILSKTFNALKKNHYNYVLKNQVAEDYYDLYVTQLVFRKFREAVIVAKHESEIKWRKAVKYHNCNLLFKVFTCWRTLPAINALKREQETRKLKWRQKVLQVVPDYKPPED